MTSVDNFFNIKMKLVQLSNRNCNFNGKEFYRNFWLLYKQKENVEYKVTLSYVRIEGVKNQKCLVFFTQPKISFSEVDLDENGENKSEEYFYTSDILTFDWIYFNILMGPDKTPFMGKWEIELVIEEK